MRRKFVLSISALCALGLAAAPLTPGEALQRMRKDRSKKVSAVKMEATPVYTEKTASGEAAVYVFNAEDGQGYRILSADDAAYAVLGYSDKGCINPEEMSPALKWWLSEIGRQVSYAANHGIKSPVTPAAEGMEAIAPLVQTMWDQGEPYNNEAPTLQGRKCYTGCVATSMAQLMYYHKYPEKGQGSNSYTWSKGDMTLSMDFGNQAFDWNNMLPVYSRNGYNDKQAAAVSYLMKACGYSVNMNYGTDASGTQGSLISEALKKYFGYDGNTRTEYRVVYPASEWSRKVWDNLKNVGPVIFNGHPINESGHSFICDGYDGKGYYHFNWGWSGMSDGYYLLECMDPEAQGAGGSVGGGFNYGLNGIFGAQKPTGKPVDEQKDNLMMYGGCTATLSGNTLSFATTPWYPSGWWCASSHAIYVNVGVIIEPIDGTPGETTTRGGTLFGNLRLSLRPGYGYNSTSGPMVTLPATMADGRYKVTIGVRNLNEGASDEYYPVLNPYPMPNFVYLNVKDGKKTVENAALPSIEPLALNAESELYYGRMAKYTAKIKNTSEYEITKSIIPALLKNGQVVMVGNVAPTTVNPNTEADIEWIAKMATVNSNTEPKTATEYTLAVIDPVTYAVLGSYGTVTMNPKPSQYAMLVPTEFSLDGQDKAEKIELDGKEISCYKAETNNFNVKMGVQVYKAFFDGVITMSIYKENPESASNPIPVAMGVFQDQPFLAEDATKTYDVNIGLSGAEKNVVYILRTSYTRSTDEYVLDSKNFIVLNPGEGGVEGVGIDSEEGDVRYYNMQGVEVTRPTSGDILIRVSNGKGTKVRF